MLIASVGSGGIEAQSSTGLVIPDGANENQVFSSGDSQEYMHRAISRSGEGTSATNARPQTIICLSEFLNDFSRNVFVKQVCRRPTAPSHPRVIV